MTRPTFVVLTHCPQTTPHFNKVASELFKGTYVECEDYLNTHHGYIWKEDLWKNASR